MTPLMVVTFDMLLSGRRSTGSHEMDMDRMTRSQVVDDILNGQFEGVDKVYECTPGERCEDITEEIATLVRDRIVNEQIERGRHVDWLHEILGTSAIAWPVMEAAE